MLCKIPKNTLQLICFWESGSRIVRETRPLLLADGVQPGRVRRLVGQEAEAVGIQPAGQVLDVLVEVVDLDAAVNQRLRHRTNLVGRLGRQLHHLHLRVARLEQGDQLER